MPHPIVSTLLAWYAHHGRDLPWRHTRDAYAVWLSEVILQQTRVSQGMDYWHRFMQQWPTVEALAAATEDEVLRQWQGLGYYSRARHLLTAARQVKERGAFPHTAEQLRQLKGVGPYTAAAVASFAFGQDVVAMDGNVLRVVSRLFDIDTPIDTAKGQHEIHQLAQQLLPTGRSADYNAALMDFGANMCAPTPRCNRCPLAAQCLANANGTAQQRPVKSKRSKPKEQHLLYIYMVWQGKYTALRRRPAGDIWQGLWEPLCIEEGKVGRGERREERGEFGEGVLTLLASNVKHQLTHRTLYATFYLLTCQERPQLPDEYTWLPISERQRYAVPRLIEKLFALADKYIETAAHTLQ